MLCFSLLSLALSLFLSLPIGISFVFNLDLFSLGFNFANIFFACLFLYILYIFRYKNFPSFVFSDDGTIPYRDLFAEDDGGRTGPFLSLLQQMWREDRMRVLQEVEDFLSNAGRNRNNRSMID